MQFFYKREYDIQHIRVSQNVSFLKLVQFIKKNHGQRVMNYAGTTKAPIQCTAVCTQTDVSWVGAQPVTQSVGTTTRVADVKKTVARRRIQNQASLLHQRFVLIMRLMLLNLMLKHAKGKVRRIPLLPVCTSPPIKFKDSILNKERLKRSYQASDFLPETEISPSRSEMKNTWSKRSIKILCFLTYISNALGPMISLEIIPSAPTKLMYH